MTETVKVEKEYPSIALTDFFESTAPSSVTHVPDAFKNEYSSTYGSRIDRLDTPDIQLHCSNENCNGVRFFRCIDSYQSKVGEDWQYLYINYKCSNCQKVTKTFSLAVRCPSYAKPLGELYKFGELPVYGPPTSPKLMKLIGPDRDDFLKGRRCENQGLGIGAFVYYRRVVESQRNRIFEEIIKVAEKVSAPSEKIVALKNAAGETQFNKSLEMAKDSMPESLLINGHSPLKLLHSALSDGVHNRSDEQCLNLASSIRVVLGELAERLSQALKNEAELSRALTTLMEARNS